MRVLKYVIKLDKISRCKSKITLLLLEAFLGCKSHNNFLAIYCRQVRNSDIILSVIYNYGDTTILRLTLFGNIHSRHNLKSCSNGSEKRLIIFNYFPEHTVDTVSDTYRLLKRFDMYIGCPLSCSLFDNAVNKLYNRCILDIFLTELLFFAFLLNKSLFLLIHLSNILCLFLTEYTVKICSYVRSISKIRCNLLARNNVNIIHRKDIHRVGHCNLDNTGIILVISHWNKCILTHNFFRYKIPYILFRFLNLQINEFDIKHLTKDIINLFLRHISKLNEHLTEHASLFFLLFKCHIKLILVDKSSAHQNVAQSDLFPVIHAPSFCRHSGQSFIILKLYYIITKYSIVKGLLFVILHKNLPCLI